MALAMVPDLLLTCHLFNPPPPLPATARRGATLGVAIWRTIELKASCAQ